VTVPTPAFPPSAPAIPADGWYPDPAGSGRLRWFERGAWTAWVSAGSTSIEHPLPEIRTLPALARLPTRAVWWALVGALLGIGVAGVGSYFVDSPVGSLGAGVVGLYGTTTFVVWLVARRYGTGNLVRDLGLRFRWADVGAGLAASISARALGIAGAILVLAARQNTDDDISSGQFDAFETSDLAVILAVAAAVLAAPLFEEIFFRGFLQSALETRLGPSWAIAVASLLFASAHLSPDITTTANLVIFVVTAVAGAVLGFLYWATRRLGTAIVGHAFFNLLPSVIILVDRFG
jgi:membrane protease YdiL (CAAX protease family)